MATYSASTSYQAATGYVSTAEYRGTVTASGIESITYTVVYVGEKIMPPVETAPTLPLLPLLLALLFLLLAGGGVYLFLHRKTVCIYVPGDRPRDYKLIARFRVAPEKPEVDITGLEPYPESIVAVEIKRPLAKKLLGQTFTVRHRSADHAYTVLQDRPGDWHEFDIAEEKEEIT